MLRNSMVMGFPFTRRLVALGAREVEDEWLGLVFGFLVDGAMGMEELVGDAGENGGAGCRWGQRLVQVLQRWREPRLRVRV